MLYRTQGNNGWMPYACTNPHYPSSFVTLILPPFSPLLCSNPCLVFSSSQPLWKELRNEFKHNQIKECRGHIVNYYFADCLKKFGVSLNVWEQPKLAHAFRVKGQHGVVNFDDFQRICVLTKLHKKGANASNI